MQTRSQHTHARRALVAAALAALAGGHAMAAKPQPRAEKTPVVRPRIKLPVKPSAPSNNYMGYDLWAVEVVTTFVNFNEPGAKLIYVAKVKNIGTQDFVGSRKVWLTTTSKNGGPVVLAAKTLTSLQKNKEWTFSVDVPKDASSAPLVLTLDPDPKDIASINDVWDSSKLPAPKAPG